ncbi:hypothetical protein BBP40_002201 [Aspergillus hancockii]|nr:hypothetical protein BBP40_002201 [Aspergillus hancockii]
MLYVLVQGTGGVSIFGLQLAKAAGVMVIATTSSEEKDKKLKQLGADHVINYRSNPNWGELARQSTPDQMGVDYIMDIGGTDTLEQSASDKAQPGLLEALSHICTVRGIYVGSRTVLHRAAWAHKGIMHRAPYGSRGTYLSRDEYDMVVNRDIIHELLQRWGDAEDHLNARCQLHRRTALHLAVEAGNLEGAELLLEKGADLSACDDLGLTVVDLAVKLLNESDDQHSEDESVYAAMITLLMADRGDDHIMTEGIAYEEPEAELEHHDDRENHVQTTVGVGAV